MQENTGKITLSRFAPYIAIIGGLVFIALGISSYLKANTYIPASGVISAIEYDHSSNDGSCRVYVVYTADGRQYESELGEYNSSMDVGKNIDIRYDPDNPARIALAGNTGSYIQIAAGCLFAAGGAAALIRRKPETGHNA